MIYKLLPQCNNFSLERLWAQILFETVNWCIVVVVVVVDLFYFEGNK